MTTTPIETDYLIIGAGTTGLCVADELVRHGSGQILIADRHDRPGGHWNEAYPFVRLHQPSASYGVNSLPLGHDRIETTGLNSGLLELATGAEVIDYFDRVMRLQLLPSGRVVHRSMTEYVGGANAAGDTGRPHTLRSLLTGTEQTVTVRRKVIDTRLAHVAVPATHPAAFEVAPGLHCVPLNALPTLTRPYAAYTVVGAGKTGIDACLWLLEHGIDPAAIRWVVPRDAWLQDRANLQPGDAFLARSYASFVTQMEAIVQATSPQDLLHRLEAAGQLLRLDPAVEPTMYRCATVSRDELAELRRIRDVVRLGRLQRIEPDRIVLEHGSVAADPDTLYVHCSAVAFTAGAPEPIFQPGRIALQLVRTCQPAFSAALVGFVETLAIDDAQKNQLCSVVPLPEKPIDWLRMQATVMLNQYQWSRNDGVRQWLEAARLDGFAGRLRAAGKIDPVIQALGQRFKTAAFPAAAKLQGLLAQHDRA